MLNWIFKKKKRREKLGEREKSERMNSFWEEKFHNTERSIAFLQATHAEVLKGLHEEIEQLQKQCSGKEKLTHTFLCCF